MRPFARCAWGLLAYDVAVVAWGAYVRASGSGAGCGRHWPTCRGQIVPRAPAVATVVELSHRVSSGVAFLVTLGLFVAALRLFPRGHVVRRSATVTVALMGAEALIGAGLVLFALVAHDASLRRALSISLHLVNTFLLLAATSLTAWWASGGRALDLRGRRAIVVALGVPMVAMLVVGASGAVTALGDTLFPASSLAAGLAQDLDPSAHLFVRLRAIHPVLAVSTAAATIASVGWVRAVRPAAAAVGVLSRVTAIAAAAQVALGVVDLLARAPVTMQIAHLVMADAVWIALVLTAAAALGAEDRHDVAVPVPDVPGPGALVSPGMSARR